MRTSETAETKRQRVKPRPWQRRTLLICGLSYIKGKPPKTKLPSSVGLVNHQGVRMNTLGYLQFFDRLAEKRGASFLMERICSKQRPRAVDGQVYTYHCGLIAEQEQIHRFGHSRKAALIALYKATH